MTFYSNHDALGTRDKFFDLDKEIYESLAMRLSPSSMEADEISPPFSYSLSKLYKVGDGDTAITEECSSDLFLPSFDTLAQMSPQIREPYMETTSSPQNVITQAFTNNSSIFIPDDIRYDGVVQISSSRNPHNLMLRPRFSSQIDSIFASNSSIEDNFDRYFDCALADSISYCDDHYTPEENKFDLDDESVHFASARDIFVERDDDFENYGTVPRKANQVEDCVKHKKKLEGRAHPRRHEIPTYFRKPLLSGMFCKGIDDFLEVKFFSC
jgi:hypothetical protein